MRFLKQHYSVTLCVMLLALLAFLCSCSVSSKRDLIRFAKQHYGDCQFISEEHDGKGKDEYRTVYLKDKDTGIEYHVTTKLNDINIDGSVFGYVEGKYSDFDKLYLEYILDNAEDDIKAVENKYGMESEYANLYFYARVSQADAEKAAKEMSGIIDKYDTKGLCKPPYLVYAEGGVYVGVYDSKTGEWESSSEYEVIDYVHDNYDPNAVFCDAIGCTISEFLDWDEIDRLFPDHDGAPNGKAYYFRDSDGNLFVAIRMEDFGGNAKGIRLFRDKSYGMEEIDY